MFRNLVRALLSNVTVIREKFNASKNYTTQTQFASFRSLRKIQHKYRTRNLPLLQEVLEEV